MLSPVVRLTTLPHSPDRDGRRGDMRDADAANRRHPALSSALRISVGLSIRVHSLMLSIQLLVCLPLRLPPSSVP